MKWVQKYRLKLRRNSCVGNQQANMVAGLGNGDKSYLRMSSISDSVNNAFTSFQQANGMSSRLPTPTNVNVHGFPSSSGTFELLQTQTLNNSTNDQLNFQSMLEPKVGTAYKYLGSHHSQISPSLLDNYSMCNNDIWSSAMESPMITTWLPGESGMSCLDNLTSATLEGSLDFSFGEPLGMNQQLFQNSSLLYF